MKQLYTAIIFNILVLLPATSLLSLGELERSTIYENESAKITFSFQNSQGNLEKVERPTKIQGATISSPQTARSYQWVNGKQSNTFSVSFVISPQKLGRIQIPPVSVTVDGKKYSSPTQVLTVKKGQNPNTRRHQSTLDRFFGNNQPDYKIGSARARLKASNQRPYVGEAFKLYYQANTREFENPYVATNYSSLLDFKKFYSDIFVVKDRRVRKNGSSINGPLALQYWLVGQSAGSHRLPGHEIVVADSGNRARPVKVEVAALTINVRSLPDQGKPVNFSGNIGDFSYQAELVSPENLFQQARPFKIRLTVTGEGNFLQFSEPTLVLNKRFSALATEVKERDIEDEPYRPEGRAVIEYNLIALDSGQFSPGVLQANWFHPGLGRYQQKTIELPIKVFQAGSESSSKSFTETEKKKNRVNSWLIAALIALAIVGLGTFFLMSNIPLVKNWRTKLLGYTRQVSVKVMEKVDRASRVAETNHQVLELLQSICGKKSQLLCEEYLSSKGIDSKTILQYHQLATSIKETSLSSEKTILASENDMVFLQNLKSRLSKTRAATRA